MTQFEIIEMARQAEKYADLQVSDTDMDIWERTVYLQFAKLVAAKERNRLADELQKMPLNDTANSIAIWIRGQE